MRYSGSIQFYMDEEILDAIEARTGLRPDRPFETKVAFCNPTPGTVPALGDFTALDQLNRRCLLVRLPKGQPAALEAVFRRLLDAI